MMTTMDRGREMARLRLRAGLKGREVGAALDVDKSAVSQWENNLSSPTLDKIGKLDELYGGRGEVLALYGIKTRDDEIAQLRADLKKVAAQVEEHGKQLGQLLGVSTERAEADPDWPRRVAEGES